MSHNTDLQVYILEENIDNSLKCSYRNSLTLPAYNLALQVVLLGDFRYWEAMIRVGTLA